MSPLDEEHASVAVAQPGQVEAIGQRWPRAQDKRNCVHVKCPSMGDLFDSSQALVGVGKDDPDVRLTGLEFDPDRVSDRAVGAPGSGRP